MSARTVERREARWRASAMEARRRVRVAVCSCKVERWRVRLFCLRAEELRGEVTVRWRVSSSMRNSRCTRGCELGLVCGDGGYMCVWRREGGGWGYFFEEDLDLGFGVLLFFCGFGGDVGGGCEAGVGVEESVCLVCGQYQITWAWYGMGR